VSNLYTVFTIYTKVKNNIITIQYICNFVASTWNCMPLAISDSLLWPPCMSRIDHVWKISDRKQRTDIKIYSYVNWTIKNWNQLPAEALGLSISNLIFLETEL
jgi:hypothetical protein